MQLLGGDVSAVSAPGEGSTFTLRFPAQLPAAPTSALTRLDMAEVAGKGDARIVVVIDDEESARDLAARSLTRLGFDVRGAASGGEGLALARSLDPSLIVVDINLPDMSGWDVIQKLGAEGIDAPVIVHSVDDDRQHALSLGACDLLVKPADRDVLAATALRFARTTEISEPAAPAISPMTKTA
jgi:CheY-like chemotaxis protein